MTLFCPPNECAALCIHKKIGVVEFQVAASSSLLSARVRSGKPPARHKCQVERYSSIYIINVMQGNRLVIYSYCNASR